MIFHYKFFVSHENNFGILSAIEWVGVDLFFVLSGYLISRQVFRDTILGKFSFTIVFYAIWIPRVTTQAAMVAICTIYPKF
jgi:peptidoglycan/LPS O-acetylase OafA/YrhL